MEVSARGVDVRGQQLGSRPLCVAAGSALAASLMLLAGTQARAQRPDTASHPKASQSVGTTNGPDGPRDLDNSDVTPHCWLGCRHSLQRTSPTEWSAPTPSRIDTLEARLKGDRHPLAPAAIRATHAAPVSAAATTTESRGDIAGSAASAASTTSNAETQRYLIEEWRRSELNIADSLHHAVLGRISRVFDSAQRASVLPDDRLQIERQVDRINSMNQLTWIERRVAVYLQADSAMRAVPGPSH
jgi:hypothetical protein